MARTPSSWMSLVVALALPVVLVGNALWVLLSPWLVDLAYALPGFPDDPGGLDRGQRADLARTGMDAVRPLGPGVEALRAAELPGGGAAFEPAELRHMADVRGVIAGFAIAWAAGLAVALAAGAALRARAGTGALRAALRVGSMATLAAAAAVALFALVAPDASFTAFHGVFFEGDSWRFDDARTLRRLYPYEFWGIAAAGLGALVVAQAAGLLALVRRRRVSDGTPAPGRAGGPAVGRGGEERA